MPPSTTGPWANVLWSHILFSQLPASKLPALEDVLILRPLGYDLAHSWYNKSNVLLSLSINLAFIFFYITRAMEDYERAGASRVNSRVNPGAGTSDSGSLISFPGELESLFWNLFICKVRNKGSYEAVSLKIQMGDWKMWWLGNYTQSSLPSFIHSVPIPRTT